MGQLVTPEVYFVGYSVLNSEEVWRYLKDTNNFDFTGSLVAAREKGISDGEILCSMMAKLCYASLTLGKNQNISKVRDIEENIQGCFAQGHGSVFEHCYLNFIVHNCSRVFTHELVRHRTGTSFSQTSGRYVRTDSLDIVFDPILDPVRGRFEEIQRYLEYKYNEMVHEFDLDSMKDQVKKKQITSALRRILPNGQANEIGFGVNLRALRHTVQIRTNRHAEWEIRLVFNQIYKLVKERYKLIFCDAKEEEVNGLLEVSGMKMQPYDK